MASVRAALRALVFDHYSAQVLLERLGRLLADDLQHGRFITMVLAVLDSTENHIEFANAGHAPAFHYSASTRQVSHLESTGLPLGVIEDAQYPLGPDISIAVGDVVVLCTDGIVEAMDEQDRQFGHLHPAPNFGTEIHLQRAVENGGRLHDELSREERGIGVSVGHGEAYRVDIVAFRSRDPIQ